MSKIEGRTTSVRCFNWLHSSLLMDNDNVMKIEVQAMDCPSLLATPAPTSHTM